MVGLVFWWLDDCLGLGVLCRFVVWDFGCGFLGFDGYLLGFGRISWSLVWFLGCVCGGFSLVEFGWCWLGGKQILVLFGDVVVTIGLGGSCF